MTERIDHAAEAVRYLPATGDGMNTGRIAVAQVHATLALVEQQRIANHIALWAMPDAVKPAIVMAGGITEADCDRSAVEIAEALGLR